jgi:ketosteroid isomerase-like protein
MFERYTEKARRAIFFARFEASQYGAAYIESEHLLLGVLREDLGLLGRFPGAPGTMTDIRSDIERQITRGQRVSTSVEMPLSEQCGKILRQAGEEAQRLANRHIGTEHLLLGMLVIEGTLAARILQARGLKANAVREQMAKPPGPASFALRWKPGATTALESFLVGLKANSWEDLAECFSDQAQMVDASGKRWKGIGEIEKNFEVLFAPYAKKRAAYVVEGTDPGPAGSLVGNVLWEDVTVAGQAAKSTHRMTVVLAPEGERWPIFLIQVTPVVR